MRQTSPLRRSLLAALAIGSLFGMVAPAMAEAWPDKPIRLVVPYPPGGATDVIGRVMAEKLSGVLGQQVIVDNRAGATGTIGAGLVAKAPADGYTLLMGALTSHTISAALNPKNTPYDMATSFTPISIVGRVPLVFVVTPSLSPKTLPELIALAKSKPGSLTFASSGAGSPQHLAGEMFQRVAGVKMLHVPYKGSGPAMVDLLGGQVDTMIETAPAAQGHIKSGKLRALAAASSQRVATLPEVPTATETGLNGFEVSSMFGIVAPAGTPGPVVKKLNGALKQILTLPDVKESLLAQGAIATYTTPEQAVQAIRDESNRWTKVIKDADIRLE